MKIRDLFLKLQDEVWSGNGDLDIIIPTKNVDRNKNYCIANLANIIENPSTMDEQLYFLIYNNGL